jgi:hypothetical protein
VRKLGWQQWLMLILFLATLIVAGLFGVRAIRRAVYWSIHRDVPVRAWMTVPYVAHSYRVPPHVLYDALGINPARPHDKRTLRVIARDENRPVEEIISELQQAIARERASHPAAPAPAAKPFAGGPPP